MNSLITEHYPLFQMYQSLRAQLIADLSDDDLSFRPAAGNPASTRTSTQSESGSVSGSASVSMTITGESLSVVVPSPN